MAPTFVGAMRSRGERLIAYLGREFRETLTNLVERIALHPATVQSPIHPLHFLRLPRADARIAEREEEDAATLLLGEGLQSHFFS